MKKEISDLNEIYNQENADIMLSVFKPNDVNFMNLTYYNLKKFTRDVYNVRKVPNDSVNFFLVLSPVNNFYINENLKSIESQISNKFDDTIILNGFLRFNNEEVKNEYHITDLLYYNEPLINNSFDERFAILYDLQNLIFASIIDEILIYPDIYTNIIEGSYEIIDSNKQVKIVFIDTACCNYIIWGNKDIYQDVVQLQILEKSKQTIKFGYNNNSIPEGIGLDFLNSYTFNKREIPEDLYVNDYFSIKINRNASGNVVPNRKISILNKSEMFKTFEQTIDILLIKFNPIQYTFFNDTDEWDTPNNVYTFSDGVLSVS